MATVLDVARATLAAINTDAGVLLASRWVSDRFKQLASRSRLRSLRQIGGLTIPAPVEAGVATIARGARIVTGDAPAQAVWDATLIGRHFRARVVWYRIVNVTSGTLELESAFAEDSVTSGAYKVVQRFTPLDLTARWLGDFLHVRRRIPLQRVSLAELNMHAPERQSVGPGPFVYTETVFTDQGTRQVEMYPYPSITEFISYVFWPVPTDLKPHDLIPVTTDPYALREGALIDLMRYEMSKSAQIGNEAMSAFWRNEYRAQATTWERIMLEAIRTDRGHDDATFILERHGLPPVVDIRTAREYVLANWPR